MLLDAIKECMEWVTISILQDDVRTHMTGLKFLYTTRQSMLKRIRRILKPIVSAMPGNYSTIQPAGSSLYRAADQQVLMEGDVRELLQGENPEDRE